MKKRLVKIAPILLGALLLAACQSQAAKSVDEKIIAIGEVTLDSEGAILDAENALAALDQKDARTVRKTKQLEQARSRYNELVEEKRQEEMKALAVEADQEIEAIGSGSDDTASRIKKARKAYEDLPEDAKPYVSRLGELEAAENELMTQHAQRMEERIRSIGTVTLDSEATVKAVRRELKALTEEERAMVSNQEDLEKAELTLRDLKVKDVTDKIAAIGEVTLDSEEAIDEAYHALLRLDQGDRKLVENRDQVDAARERLREIKAEHGEELLKSFHIDEDKVRGITFYLPYDYNNYKGCFVGPYIGRKSDQAWMNCYINYKGSEWIFYDSIIIAADDRRFTIDVEYDDVDRDAFWGGVYECYHFPVYTNELAYLQAIIDADETIIRFDGKNSYYDYTVTEKDKQAIRKAMDAYRCL